MNSQLVTGTHHYDNDSDALFREAHYARHGHGRTNIYGLAILESRLPTYLERQDDFPSSRFDKLPDTHVPCYKPPLPRPIRHVFSASATELTAFISRHGYWANLCIGLGLDNATEIISLEVVEDGNDSAPRLFIALALAEKHVTESEDSHVTYSLRIYNAVADERLPFLEQVLFNMQGSMQRIPLQGAPMQLCNTMVKHKKRHEIAFMLSTTDGSFHLVIQDRDSGVFVPTPIETYFPMLGHIAEKRIKILVTQIYVYPDGRRMICAGSQQGEIFLGSYDKEGMETSSHVIRVFSPITSVLLFQSRASQSELKNSSLNLVVTCAIEQAMVYRSVDRYGFSFERILPQSTLYDSVLCSHVMDVDWDGEMEILIGTYGRQVLIYKRVEGTHDYNVLWKRQFAYPIYRISHLDLNQDGLDELIITTMYGVHILQPDINKAKQRLLQVLQYIEDNRRYKYEMLLAWQRQRELEKAIIFEAQQ